MAHAGDARAPRRACGDGGDESRYRWTLESLSSWSKRSHTGPLDVGEDQSAPAERGVAAAVGPVAHDGDVRVRQASCASAKFQPGGDDPAIGLEGHVVERAVVESELLAHETTVTEAIVEPAGASQLGEEAVPARGIVMPNPTLKASCSSSNTCAKFVMTTKHFASILVSFLGTANYFLRRV